MAQAVKTALGSLTAHHALDAITSNGTWVPLSQLVDPNGGQVSVVSGVNKYDDPEIQEGVAVKYTYVGTVHSGEYLPQMPKQPEDKESVKSDPDFAYVLLRFVARMMARGEFRGHPTKVIEGGLSGVENGLNRLKMGQAKGVKFVYRVSDTPGLNDK
jgi:NADPH2:quinone reductase